MSATAHDLARLPLANHVTILKADLAKAEQARDYARCVSICIQLHAFQRELLAVDQHAELEKFQKLRGL